MAEAAAQLQSLVLRVLRKWFTEKTTIGELYLGYGQLLLDDKFFGYTLEDCRRQPGEIIRGATCIPAGRYRVALDWSPRFNRLMLHVLEVPGFEGVRIHAGNQADDTEGCILVGLHRAVDFIGMSRIALDMLEKQLATAISAGRECWLDISEEAQK